MAKAMLIMDMPSCCSECQLKVLPNPWSFMICGKTKKHIDKSNQRPTWCPLQEVPRKIASRDGDITRLEKIGYNACIDEILGECKDG